MTKLASLPARPRSLANTPSYPRTVCLALVALGCGGISTPGEVATGGSANVAGSTGNTAGFGPSIYETGGAPSLMGDIATVFETGGAPGTGGAAPVATASGGAANFAGGVAAPFETGGAAAGTDTNAGGASLIDGGTFQP
jgi:hypothetical protein